MALYESEHTKFMREMMARHPEWLEDQRRGRAQHIRSIARIQLAYLEKRLAQLEMKLEVADAVLSAVAATGFDPVYGARPLKRAIQSQIEDPLAKAILEGRFVAGDTIRVLWENGIVRFDKGSAT